MKTNGIGKANRLAAITKIYGQVKTIEDAKSDEVFEVTANDVKNSVSKSVENCALARCARRQFDGAIISISVAYLIQGTRAYRYRVPASVSRELVAFDRSRKFAPGIYYLHAPPPSRRLGADHHVSERSGDRTKNGPLRHKHKTSGIRKLG